MYCRQYFATTTSCTKPQANTPGNNSMDAVRASPSFASVCLIPVLTNVTDDGSVGSTVETVTAWLKGDKDRRLHAIVNNAGVGRGGPCDMLEMKDYHIDMVI